MGAKTAIKDMLLSEIKQEIQQHQVDLDQNYVFISYAHKDDRVVYPKVLEWIRAGYNIYIDTDFENHGSDENWVSIMTDRIQDSACVMAVCFCSEHYCFSYASLIELLTMKSKRTLEFRKGYGAENPDTPIDIIMLENQPVSEGRKFSPDAEAAYRDTYFPEMRNRSGNEFLGSKPLEESLLREGLITLYGEETANLKISILKSGYKKTYKNFYPAIAIIVNEWFMKNNLNGNTKSLNSPGVLARFTELEVYQSTNQEPEETAASDHAEEVLSAASVQPAPEDVPQRPDGTISASSSPHAPALKTYHAKNAAITQINDREFLLHSGAHIRKKTADSCAERSRRLRLESLDKGEWQDMGDYYILRQDKLFKSLSGAAGYITGSSVNGNLFWSCEEAAVSKPAKKAAPTTQTSDQPQKKTDIRIDFVPEPVSPVAKTERGNVTLGEIREKMADDPSFCQRLGNLRKNGLPFGAKSYMDYAMAAVLGGCNEVKETYQKNYYNFCVASTDKKENAKVSATWTWPSNARKTIGYVGSGIINREINSLFENLPKATTINQLIENFEACREEAYITKKNNLVLLALSELARVYSE